MRSTVMAIALAAAACGGASKPATAPAGETAPVVAARLELAEISITENGKGLAVHVNGSVEVVDGDNRKPIGTLSADGKFVMSDGSTYQLNDDGSVTTKGGPAPFRVEDEALVVSDIRITLDANNVIQDGVSDLSAVKVTGVTNRGTRRTALMMIAFLTHE